MHLVIMMGPEGSESHYKVAKQCQSLLWQHFPKLKIEIWPEVSDFHTVDLVMLWKQPHHQLKKFPNLKAILATAAGIDHITEDPSFSNETPVFRVHDESQKKDMAEYVTYAVLHYLRGFHHLNKDNKAASWQRQHYVYHPDNKVGIMGYGYLGKYVAQTLSQFNFGMNIFARHKYQSTQKNLRFFTELDQFLATTNILICLLPLTPATRYILNKKNLLKLPKGAYIINVARGKHLVPEDLLQLIETKHIAGAFLDAFDEEPLPSHHPFWTTPEIEVTPHISAMLGAEDIVRAHIHHIKQIEENNFEEAFKDH